MEFLKNLTQTVAVSGNEENIFSLITTELNGFADEIYTDNLNNIIVHKKGNGKKLMFSAHTDEIGIMANYIDDKGSHLILLCFRSRNRIQHQIEYQRYH